MEFGLDELARRSHLQIKPVELALPVLGLLSLGSLRTHAVDEALVRGRGRGRGRVLGVGAGC